MVYKLIKELGTTSKVELSKLTGISSPTVIKIVDYLISKNLVLEIGEGESAVGRKPQLLTLNKHLMYTASFFIEGDHLMMGIVDIVGSVILRKELRVEPDINAILRRITDELLEPLLKEAGVPAKKLAGIGIALPCIYDAATRCVSSSPLIGVDSTLFIGDLLDRLAGKYNVTVQVENDTNAQALGEYQITREPPHSDLVFISIGTGLGAGIILDGKLRHGPHNTCGEIGSFAFLSQEGGLKRENSIERQIGSRLLEKRFGMVFDRSVQPDASLIGDIIDYIAPPLASCINNIAALLDCRTIVLGGIVSDVLGPRLADRIQQELRNLSRFEYVFRRQTSPETGLVGISSLITEQKISDLLTSQSR